SELLRGSIDIVASDHSPAPPEMKAGDFWQAWGGIAGVQSTLAVLLDRGYHTRALPLPRIAALLAANPAHRFRIPGKGSLVPGADADLAIVDLSRSFQLKLEDLKQRHTISPYVGSRFRGAVQRTIRRGETIFADGNITARNQGILVRPSNTYESSRPDAQRSPR
ncbi:MAG: amidohydrolase family protein, partial [Acidobacteriota bacterium]|nr:amidohydrolase family protein [Acidobacteriota bacterium]